jgi:hypothetical protein
MKYEVCVSGLQMASLKFHQQKHEILLQQQQQQQNVFSITPNKIIVIRF